MGCTVDVSEQRFCWLLKQRGFGYWAEDQLDQKIKVRKKRPDFYVEAPPNWKFLVEVESFQKSGPLRGWSGGARARDPLPILKRIRTDVGHAAQQLNPYRGLNMPMLVILDNWRQVGLRSNASDLWDALFRPLRIRP